MKQLPGPFVCEVSLSVLFLSTMACVCVSWILHFLGVLNLANWYGM